MEKFNVQDLIDAKLVHKNTDPLTNHSVLKYHRRVFYDNLWDQDPRLVQCRGIVVDEEDKIVSLPFDKCFNLGENGTEVSDDHLVSAPRKVNGFLGVCTRWGDKYVVSSSGSLNSKFAELANKWIMKGRVRDMQNGYTYCFEICDPSDPHIVPEKAGAYLIGCRKASLGSPQQHEYILDREARIMGYKRPEVITGRFGDIKNYFSNTEGMMLRDQDSGEILCKLKTPHYLTIKWLSRISKRNMKTLFENPDNVKMKVDEEYFKLVDHIHDMGVEVWSGLDEHQRRVLIRDFFEKEGAF